MGQTNDEMMLGGPNRVAKQRHWVGATEQEEVVVHVHRETYDWHDGQTIAIGETVKAEKGEK